MPLMPWLPLASPQRSLPRLSQGEKSLKKKKKKKKIHSLYTANNKKRDKTAHAKAKITIKMLTSIST